MRKSSQSGPEPEQVENNQITNEYNLGTYRVTIQLDIDSKVTQLTQGGFEQAE